jgi:EAL domain-containing protein (putative c-di-GMP-specific phosphodiesterase class I)
LDRIVASFRQLKKAGITTAIDDFGTGYSNLVSLQSFEPDVLKIDKSFVDGIPGNPKSCKLARAVLDIAKGLDMRVVAEGVETREQADFLPENGCHVMQGYLFSKPLNADLALAYSV